MLPDKLCFSTVSYVVWGGGWVGVYKHVVFVHDKYFVEYSSNFSTWDKDGERKIQKETEKGTIGILSWVHLH